MIFGPLASPTTLAVTVAPPSWSGRGEHGVAVDEQDGPELDLAVVDAEALDVEPLAALDLVLLAAGVRSLRTWRVETSEIRWSDPERRRARNLGSLQHRLVDDEAAPAADGAGLRERLDQALGDPLAGHLDQAELGDREHLGAGLVPGQRLAERLFDRLAVLAGSPCR